MTKKRAINEQDKINFSKGKKFSTEYQPTPKAKSEGKLKKKTMREVLDILMEKQLTNAKGEKATTLEAMMTACIKKALTGDIKANEFIRDTLGQKPTQEINLNGQIQKVFITPEQQKEAEAHIKKMIEE